MCFRFQDLQVRIALDILGPDETRLVDTQVERLGVVYMQLQRDLLEVEADIRGVLDYARELRRQLTATGRYKVVLTRERDIFLPLRDRVQTARDAGAGLFISLHVNTDPRSSTRGFSVYTLSARGSDQEAAALAAKENKANIIAGMDFGQYSDDVANILIDFAQTKTTEFSVRFARDLLTAEVRQAAKLLRRPWRSAASAN